MRYRILAGLFALWFIGVMQLTAQDVLRFDQQVIDAGTMTEDDAPRTYTFVARNVSGRVQEIARLQTTCGCTKSSMSQTRLQPGDSCEWLSWHHRYPCLRLSQGRRKGLCDEDRIEGYGLAECRHMVSLQVQDGRLAAETIQGYFR